MANNKVKTIVSPCIMVCHIDHNTGLCLGCYRNLDEIGNWVKYTEKRRLEIMAQLQDRKVKYNLP